MGQFITYTASADEPLRIYSVVVIETDFSKIPNVVEMMTKIAMMHQKPEDKKNLEFKRDKNGDLYVTVAYVDSTKSDDGSTVDWWVRQRIYSASRVNNFYLVTMMQKKAAILTPDEEDPLLFINSFEITNP